VISAPCWKIFGPGRNAVPDKREIRDGGGVLVANPGGIPEMLMMAVACAKAGILGEYVTPVAVSSAPIPSQIRWAVPSQLRMQIERQLKRRELPASLSTASIQRQAWLFEWLHVLSRQFRLLGFAESPVIRLRNRRFDRGVAQRLRQNDTALITVYSAALRALKRSRALAVPSYLEYPIAHHSFAERILFEEARREPEYAPTLQFHRFPPAYRRQLEAEIDLADHIFVLSSFQKRTFLEAGVDAEKLIVTPLGVDVDLFHRTATDEDGVFRVLFVGQITQRKGISYLVKAFRLAAIPNSELKIVGRLRGTVQPWSMVPNVRRVSPVPRWELPALYQAADVFVLPSLVEGFPLTALEAMACGIPVIVSEHTFGEDVVRDGIDGFVTPIRDSEAIADRLRYLYKNPDRRELMAAAARHRAEQFTWNRYGERIVAAVGGPPPSVTMPRKVI
jgi:glycosyltransferase involved in cell wall biosynthesis